MNLVYYGEKLSVSEKNISFDIRCHARAYCGNVVRVKLSVIPSLCLVRKKEPAISEFNAFSGCEKYNWHHRVCLLCQRAVNEYVYCLAHHLEAEDNIYDYIVADSLRYGR